MGGELALDAAWLFAAFLIIVLLAAGGIAARRFLLERGGGTVECGLRKGSRSWRLGLASYQREELCWFGSFGLSLRPDEVFPRRDLAVVSRRLPTDAETATLGPGMIVVECHLGEDGGQLGSAVAGAPGPSGTPGASGPGAYPPGAPGAYPPGAGAPGGHPPDVDPSDAPGAGAPGAGAPDVDPSDVDPSGAGAPGGSGADSVLGAGGFPGSSGPFGAGDAPGAGSNGAPGPPNAPGRAGTGGTRDPGESVELAMGEAALTGLLAWLEAAPPGSHLGVPL